MRGEAGALAATGSEQHLRSAFPQNPVRTWLGLQRACGGPLECFSQPLCDCRHGRLGYSGVFFYLTGCHRVFTSRLRIFHCQPMRGTVKIIGKNA
ncbi:unnamed protein product [Ciceribacter sp. T2.26MG-112.2]|nr:unnamed protein product [Ciceribacter naphthalenivorans]